MAGVTIMVASFAVELAATSLGFFVLLPGAIVAAVGLTLWRGPRWPAEFFDRFL